MADRRRSYPTYQVEVESQQRSVIRPYRPDFVSDVQNMPARQEPHPISTGGAVPFYIIPTFDARPINAHDWTTMTGTNKGGGAHPDTGFPGPAADGSASLFYAVPIGRVAIVRDWDVSVTFTGPLDGASEPINPVTGVSQVSPHLTFFVDGNPAPDMSAIQLSMLAFGDVFGDAYIIAGEGSLIEMRLTPDGANPFAQVLMSMHGDTLLSRGLNIELEPATDFTLPMHDTGQAPGSASSGGSRRTFPNPATLLAQSDLEDSEQ